MRSSSTLALRSAIAVATVALGACRTPTPARAPDGVFAHLAGCESVELFALYPHFEHPLDDELEFLAMDEFEEFHVPEEYVRMVEREAAGLNPPPFCGWPVLGRAQLAGEERCNELLALLEDGVEAHERWRAETGINRAALCFMPRHGISIEIDGRVEDLVICYQCTRIRAYVDGQFVDSFEIERDRAAAVTAIFESRGLAIHAEEE